ncbi:unnamed protein product [Somion occarium]|uniref:Transmembrane protein n=1 Tax=Somion occarium TaxID=3059160 RepID=A0ABP1E8A4_9APHY
MSTIRRVSILSGLILALASFVPGALAQGTNAICKNGFRWMVNSRGQSPCSVAAYLLTPCIDNRSDAYVEALHPSSHYLPPSPSTATPCQCSSVHYSMLQACAICQGGPSVPWSTWVMNCNAAAHQSYPYDVPAGTSVPAWAYLDISLLDNFDVTSAEALADTHPPDSTAIGTATSTGNVAPTTSGTTSTSNRRTNVGVIVGGVIVGVIGLALVGGAVWWFMRRRWHTKVHVSASQFKISDEELMVSDNEKQSQQQPLLSSPVPQMGMSPPPFAPHPVPTSPPIAEKIYNPDDPSTFPDALLITSSSSAAYSQPADGHSQNVKKVDYTQTSGQYSGVPEL